MWRFIKLGIPKFHEIGFSWSNCTLERSFLLWGSTNYRNSFLKYWFWRSVCGISSLLSHGPSYAIIERSKNMEIWSNPACSRDGRGVQAAIERLWPRFKKRLVPGFTIGRVSFFYFVFSKFMSGCRCLFLLVFLLCFSASSLFRLSACPFPCFLRFYVSLIYFFFMFFLLLCFSAK